MARLPDFRDLGERPTPQPGTSVARVEPQRDQLGELMSRAGGELQDAALILDQTNERQDQIVAQAAANTYREASILEEHDPKAGFRSVKAGGTVGSKFVDDYLGRLKDKGKGIATDLQNDRQRKMFQQAAQVVDLQFRSSLMQHQAHQTEVFNDQTADNTIELSLRSMAQDPTNELAFQTAMVQIEATVDATVARKGMPAEAGKMLRGKYTDAAYGARIMSLLEGVPGLSSADPYAAEDLFKKVQGSLGSQAQLTLGRQVLAGVKEIQLRDGARAEVYGTGALDARKLYPATEGVKPLSGSKDLVPVVLHLESRGKRFDAQGNVIQGPMTSTGERAVGEMQVMPATAKAPGHGIAPAKDDSPEEYARVGRELIGALTARYQSVPLALAAYNAGHGIVDDWIAGTNKTGKNQQKLRIADPRTGGVSEADWASEIPFAETRDYVQKGLKKIATAGGAPETQPAAGPTANQLKAEMVPALLLRARATAESMYPNDPKFVDAYVARTLGYANEVLGQQRARQDAASDTLTRALVGEKGDGSDAVKSMDQVMSSPMLRQAFETATPQAQLALQTRLAQGNKGFDSQSFQLYYSLLGKAGEDPAEFTKVDLGVYYGQLPDEKLVELARYQRSINAKDASQQQRDLNWQRTMSNVEDMLKPLGLGRSAKKESAKAKTTEQFYGRLNEAVQEHFNSTGKWPDTQTTRKFAATLLTEGAQRGSWFGFYDEGVRVFEADPSKFYIPLPSGAERAQLTAAYRKVFGRDASDRELRDYWTRFKMSGGKLGPNDPVAQQSQTPQPRRSMSGRVVDDSAAVPDMRGGVE